MRHPARPRAFLLQIPKDVLAIIHPLYRDNLGEARPNVRIANQENYDVDGFRNKLTHWAFGDLRDKLLDAEKAGAGIVGMYRADAPRMSGVPCLQHV